MKTKEIYGVKFKVYTDTEIEGDFIHPDEAVYFENDVEIAGELEVKYLKCEKSITVHKSYIVDRWEEVGGYQKVGGSQKIGRSQKVGRYQEVDGYQEVGEFQEVSGSQEVGKFQEVGDYQKIGRYQKVGGSQKVGGYQKVSGYQKVGGSQEVGKFQEVSGSQKIGWSQKVGRYQKIGRFQKVSGDLTARSVRVSLSSTVDGKYNVEGKVFIGVCEWRETTEEEERLTCGEFVSGDIKYGRLVETNKKKKVEEMTMEQICKELGREIKIKKD